MRGCLIVLFLFFLGCNRAGLNGTSDNIQHLPDMQEREQYIKLTPGLTPDVTNNILSGKVSIGMTQNDVLAIMGVPCHVFDMDYGFEKWVYDYNSQGFMNPTECSYSTAQNMYFKGEEIVCDNESDFMKLLGSHKMGIKKAQKKALLKPKQEYIRKHGITKDIADLILEGSVAIGMTREDVRASVGDPKNINKTVYALGDREQWVYSDNFYLYFDNGKVTSWQEYK